MMIVDDNNGGNGNFIALLIGLFLIILGVVCLFNMDEPKTMKPPKTTTYVMVVDGTYVKPKVDSIFDDTLSDFCFEMLDDTTIRLRCACSCEEYRAKQNEE